MRRFFLAALGAMMITASATAQSTVEETVEYSADKFKVETNRFWNNTFVSVGSGLQVMFSDHDKQCDFADRLAPALDVAVGKWFTPGIGVRLMYSGLSVKGATQNNSHSTGAPVPGKGGHGYWLTEQEFDVANFHADVMFNISNLFFGYNEKRIWNVSPYFGLGLARVWESPSSKDVAANFGIINSFRITKRLDINLDVRSMIVSDHWDGEAGKRKHDAIVSANIGLTCRLGKTNWDRSKTVYRTDYGELNSMRDRLNSLMAENARLKDALAKKPTATETVVKKVVAANFVAFKINKSELSKEARVNLGMLADAIKAGDKDAVYTVTGYADEGTGSKARNERLSQERAQAVYDCLVNEFGVAESQLRIDYKGGVENMFYDDARLSRAAITRVQE